MTTTTDPRTRYYREYDLARARTAVSHREPAAHQQQALDKLTTWFNSPSRRGGTPALRHSGASALRHSGTPALRHSGVPLWCTAQLSGLRVTHDELRGTWYA